MAKIPELTADMEVIQKLGRRPNTDDGLTEAGFKAKFDEAGIAIKKFINEKVVDLTEYSTLQATCKASGGSNTKLEVYSGSSTVASTAIGTDLTTVTVDISALSGLHSIGFAGRHTAYLSITYTATEIKLLK